MENAITSPFGRNHLKTVLSKGIIKSLHIIYRAGILPLFKAVGFVDGPCRFEPTCSHYSREAFEVFSFWKAFELSGRRISKCHPWNHSDQVFDPVPSLTGESNS